MLFWFIKWLFCHLWETFSGFLVQEIINSKIFLRKINNSSFFICNFYTQFFFTITFVFPFVYYQKFYRFPEGRNKAESNKSTEILLALTFAFSMLCYIMYKKNRKFSKKKKLNKDFGSFTYFRMCAYQKLYSPKFI